MTDRKFLCENPELPVRQEKTRGPIGPAIHRHGCPRCVQAVEVLVQSGLLNPRRQMQSARGVVMRIEDWLLAEGAEQRD